MDSLSTSQILTLHLLYHKKCACFCVILIGCASYDTNLPPKRQPWTPNPKLTRLPRQMIINYPQIGDNCTQRKVLHSRISMLNMDSPLRRRRVYPHRRELCWGDERPPRSQQRRAVGCSLHICTAGIKRCVADGFTPSRPSRSPGPYLQRPA